MLNYVRSVLETPDKQPMYDMLTIFRNAPSQAPELWSSIKHQVHYNQGFIEGGTAILKKTADEGGFGFGYPVGLFDAETHKLMVVAPSQTSIPTIPKIRELLNDNFPPGIQGRTGIDKDIVTINEKNTISQLFNSIGYQEKYMLETLGGKYYFTKLPHAGL